MSFQAPAEESLAQALQSYRAVADEVDAALQLAPSLAEKEDFAQALQSFQAVENEIDTTLRLSPSIFDISTQVGSRSAGPPSEEEPFTPERPEPPAPVEWVVGEGPLPLEDSESTDAQSSDTQISSHEPHPGYPFTHYNCRLHGAPISLPTMDDLPS